MPSRPNAAGTMNAGKGIGTCRVVGHQHVEVGHRTVASSLNGWFRAGDMHPRPRTLRILRRIALTLGKYDRTSPCSCVCLCRRYATQSVFPLAGCRLRVKQGNPGLQLRREPARSAVWSTRSTHRGPAIAQRHLVRRQPFGIAFAAPLPSLARTSNYSSKIGSKQE